MLEGPGILQCHSEENSFLFCAVEVATSIASFLQPQFTYRHELAAMGVTSVLEQLASLILSGKEDVSLCTWCMR